ncbi:MAG: hypothetical protein NTU61_00095 [Candidatus Altiarchaeota archaeon]|nr:hypothetical protein [Candidatus Altiarchaeota archaeon]
MVLNNKGYIYTVLVIAMSILVTSLLVFYSQSVAVISSDSVTRMHTEEMHYFVESIKSDCSRALSITGQRATAYATNYILISNKSLENYTMRPCQGFKYPTNGSQAAITELMLCGTFQGATGPESRYMQNNTLLDWINRTEQNSQKLKFNSDIKLNDLTIGLYDPYNLLILSHFDIIVYDEFNQTRYAGYNIPITAVIPASILEDPLYYLQFSMPPSMRVYKKCVTYPYVNGSVIDSWITEKCYLPVSFTYSAPSVFDRLDGLSQPNPAYVTQAINLSKELNYTLSGIGLESMLDLNELIGLNVSVNSSLSQIDHMYWNKTVAYCWVKGMDYSSFRIDTDHALRYKVKDLYCAITITGNGGAAENYTPDALRVPVNTTVYWVNADSISHTLVINPNLWVGNATLPPGGRLEKMITTPGTFNYMCVNPGHSAAGTVIVS